MSAKQAPAHLLERAAEPRDLGVAPAVDGGQGSAQVAGAEPFGDSGEPARRRGPAMTDEDAHRQRQQRRRRRRQRVRRHRLAARQREADGQHERAVEQAQ